MVPLNEYILNCAEDDKTNRFIESINLYQKIIKNKIFEKIPKVLLFTKGDKLKELIKEKNFKNLKSLGLEYEIESDYNYDNILNFHYEKYKNILSENKIESFQIYTVFSMLDPVEVKSIFNKILIDFKFIDEFDEEDILKDEIKKEKKKFSFFKKKENLPIILEDNFIIKDIVNEEFIFDLILKNEKKNGFPILAGSIFKSLQKFHTQGFF
jgi:hypothetical protein